MDDLRKLWSTQGLLKANDDNGIPEGANFWISGLSSQCRPVGLIDFCTRLGLETAGLSFTFFDDVARNDYEVCLSIIWDMDFKKSVCRFEGHTVFLEAGSEEQLNKMLRWLAASWPHDLPNELALSEGLITKLTFYQGVGYAHFKNGSAVNQKFITNEWSTDEKDFLAPVKFNGLCDLWRVTGFYQSKPDDLNNRLNVGFQFPHNIESGLLQATCEFAARIGAASTSINFPLSGTGAINKDLLFSINQTVEREATIRWKRNSHGGITIGLSGGYEALNNAIKYLGTAIPVDEGGTFGQWEINETELSEVEHPIIIEKEWSDPGEKEDLLLNVSNWIEKNSHIDSPLCLTAYLSEPLSIRDQLKISIEQKFNSNKKSAEINIRSAFKPGYHWIYEELLPVFKEVIGLKTIKIHCKEESSEKGLELPIRWIQELYPVDILLSRELDIPSENVVFELNDNQVSTYIVEVLGENEELLYTTSLDIPVSRLTYVDQVHDVYPTTGWLAIENREKVLFEKHIPTDRERFWAFFSEEILNRLVNQLPLHDKDRGDKYPFFSELIVNVSMSEEERKLGIAEERISPLEALHEDIYFNTLDYFVTLGERHRGKGWETPGSVRPFMHLTEGQSPSAKVMVKGWYPQNKKAYYTESLSFTNTQVEPTACELVDQNGINLFVPQPCRYNKQKAIKYYGEAVDSLSDIPGIHMWRGGRSYEGRDIAVVELTPSIDATFVSPHKLALHKPTILIETGHHANEVSSMAAIDELIKELVNDKKDVLQHVNLVVIPCANPDGCALHEELVKEHPEWKHHAARYNAVGLEYAHVRYQDTVFGEADVVPNIMRRWRPDVNIDNHGIPSHEWVQPFAGYNSPPRFPVSYWMPNALIYGIAKQLDPHTYPLHKRTLDQMINMISEIIADDEEVANQNDIWMNRYEKYGHQWLPDTFPIEDTNRMIFYRWPTDVNPSNYQAIARYPEFCSIELITEAADETVYGDTLRQCVKSQKLFNMAVLDFVSQTKVSIHKYFNRGLLKYERKRPLLIESMSLFHDK